MSTADNHPTPATAAPEAAAGAASSTDLAVARAEVNRLHRAVCDYANRLQYLGSVLRSDGKRVVEETAEMRMRELDSATATVAQLQEQVQTVDANAATIAEAVPSLLQLLEADHPGNYCEMTASASDGTPVIITYQRGDRPTPHDLKVQAEAQRDATLGRVEAQNKALSATQATLERTAQERDRATNAYLGTLQDAGTIAGHAEACGVVSTPAYELAARRILERTSASPMPALQARVRELEQQLAEREETNREDLARLEEAVNLGSCQATAFDLVLAERDERIRSLEAALAARSPQ